MARIWKTFLGAGLGVALFAGLRTSQEAQAQSAASSATAPSGGALAYQRSFAIYNLKTTAESGPARGQEIYYFKCYMCHNELAKAGPRLRDLYQRPRLLTGQPVNDQTVAEKIREGGARMPAYRYALTDTDMADLLSYIRDRKCCFEGDNPPPNPLYRYR